MYCLNCHNQSDSDINCTHCSVFLSNLTRDLLQPGTLFKGGQYGLIEAIGRGGFGVTYRVHDAKGQEWAIKEFFPDAQVYRLENKQEIRAYPEFVDNYARGKDRFLREALILQSLNHEHIVACLDLFCENNTAYLVMPLLRGQSLERKIEAQGKFQTEEVQALIQPIVSALHSSHQNHIFHLDIKPDNIWLESSGNVLLLDFGAARQGASRKSTQAFTLDYAPPEVLSTNTEVGAFSDIFELGMLTYQMLMGKKAPAITERLNQLQLSCPELPLPWRTLVEEALHLNPHKRPQDIQSWWQQLDSRAGSTAPKAQKRFKRKTKAYENALGMSFVWISPGRFYMGSPVSESGHKEDEILHRVELRQGFWLQKTLVTCAQWQAVMGFLPDGVINAHQHPITGVTWQEVQIFLEKLNLLDAGVYQLPTEAQWEYACRAGARRAFCFGNRVEQLSEYAWHLDNTHEAQTVGQLEANLWGLFDMHGNVCEWCADDYLAYGHRPRVNPCIKAEGPKVYRGGSYQHQEWDCRSARRFQAEPSFKSPWLGFRLLSLLPEGSS